MEEAALQKEAPRSFEELELRSLRTRDFRTLVRIMSHVTDDLQPRIVDILKRQEVEGDERSMLLGIAVFESMFREAAEEITNWLADMANLSPEQFDEMPFDAPIKLADRILQQEREHFPAFFDSFSALMNTATGLVRESASIAGAIRSSLDTDGPTTNSTESEPGDS